MFKIVALDMITVPNYFKTLTSWDFIAGNTARLWFELQIADSLGERRYIPAAGSQVKIEFPRARTQSIQNTPPPSQQTITKIAAQDVSDKSFFYVDLLSTETPIILGGTVKVYLTESGVTSTFVQNYFVNRKSCVSGN